MEKGTLETLVLRSAVGVVDFPAMIVYLNGHFLSSLKPRWKLQIKKPSMNLSVSVRNRVKMVSTMKFKTILC